MMLDISVEKMDGFVWRGQSFGDLVITGQRPAQVLRLSVFVDDALLWEVRGDGVVIATPAGAEDYASRVSGVWMDPLSDAVMIVPVCCHNMNARPVILSGRRKIKVIQGERDRTCARLVVDGRSTCSLRRGECLTIAVSKCPKGTVRPRRPHESSCSPEQVQGGYTIVSHCYQKTAP